MVLIQEMALKVDQGFLGAIMALFTPATDPEAERKRVTFFFFVLERIKVKTVQLFGGLNIIEQTLKPILDFVSFRQS